MKLETAWLGRKPSVTEWWGFAIDMSGSMISLIFHAVSDLFSSCPPVLQPFKWVRDAVETTHLRVLKYTPTPEFQTQRQ